MADLIKRALTRRRFNRGRLVEEQPNEKLVFAVKFAVGMTACLSALEVAHLLILGVWNSEIFASITGLSGAVVGLFAGNKT